MTTFSQLIDDMIAESRRMDMKREITTYLNQTIRDVHFNQQNKALIKFGDNLVESEIMPTDDYKFVWPISKPQRFAKVEAVFYPAVDSQAVERKPSSMHTMGDDPAIWYRSGSNIIFSGYGGSDMAILFAYLQYPRQLVYYPVADRPAVWDDATESYTYHANYTSTPELQAEARDLSTNWLLERWQHCMQEGLRAKLYKKVADDVRMRTAFSAFESNRNALVAAESFENGVFFAR